MITVINRSRGNRPEGTTVIYAGRPGPLGNPFTVATWGRGSALQQFAEWFHGDAPQAVVMREYALSLPDDAVLECFCVPQPCHATIIANFVNKTRGLT